MPEQGCGLGLQFEPRNSSLTEEVLYLESKNKCVGWSNTSWLDQSQIGNRRRARPLAWCSAACCCVVLHILPTHLLLLLARQAG